MSDPPATVGSGATQAPGPGGLVECLNSLRLAVIDRLGGYDFVQNSALNLKRGVVEIALKPGTEELAGDLHAAFGDSITIYVGDAPYP